MAVTFTPATLDFGDGEILSMADVQATVVPHTYATAGTYQATLNLWATLPSEGGANNGLIDSSAI